VASHAAPRRSTWQVIRSARVRAILSLGIVLGFGVTATLAQWTDTANVTTGTFTAGSLDLQIDGNQGKPAAYAKTALAMPDMYPGASVAAMLAVQNKSSAAKLTYTMTGSATGTLGAALKLKIFTGGTAANANGVGTCDGTQVGSEISLSNTAGTAIISTERGPLAASTGVENLCFRVELPAAAPDALQGQSSVATFVFTATSVAP
jgi:predicted ribosomally synthesized peptide with SipW-like signal peptide